MNTNNIIKSLNLTNGEVLTLQKLADRMEFEVFAVMPETKDAGCTCFGGGIYIEFPCPIECTTLCPSFTLNPCDCDGPVGYINCRPYK